MTTNVKMSMNVFSLPNYLESFCREWDTRACTVGHILCVGSFSYERRRWQDHRRPWVPSPPWNRLVASPEPVLSLRYCRWKKTTSQTSGTSVNNITQLLTPCPPLSQFLIQGFIFFPCFVSVFWSVNSQHYKYQDCGKQGLHIVCFNLEILLNCFKAKVCKW